MKRTINHYFDKVFVLSLPHDGAKRARMSQLLGDLGVEFEFFDALNGNDLVFDRQWQFYQSRPITTSMERQKMRKLITSRGAWGCLKSYIALLKKSLAANYERILVLEDDVSLALNFVDDFETFLTRVSDDWKLLFLGASQAHWSEHSVNEHFYHATPLLTNGSFAIGYHRTAMRSILYEAVKMESPYDKEPLASVMNAHPHKCFVSFPNIIIADVRESNIRAGRDMVAHAEKMKWNLDLFDLTK